MKSPWIIIAVLIVVLFGGAIWFSNIQSQQANEGVTTEDHIKGNTEATVVLEEYGDFQCPACGQFFPIVQEIMADYGDQVRFEFHHFPLMQIHPLAEPAARAAEAAGQQGKFYEYHDALYQNQSTWAGQGGSASGVFTKIAEELELDMDLFIRHQRSSVLREKIQADLAEGLQRGVQSTPTFFLNGERVELSVIGDLRTAVEAALGVNQVPDTMEIQLEDGSTSTIPIEIAPTTPSVQFGI